MKWVVILEQGPQQVLQIETFEVRSETATSCWPVANEF